MKVIINNCYGGFGLSKKAFAWLIENKGWRVTDFNEAGDYVDNTAHLVRKSNQYRLDEEDPAYYFVGERDNLRINADVMEVIEKLREEADGPHAELKIVHVPDDVEWQVKEYDGMEWVAEKHRTWG